MSKHVLKRLSVLQGQAANTPVPARKYFHIGQPEQMAEVGECVPMIAWVDDNLSRYVVSDSPSERWGRVAGALLVTLPNMAVKSGEGVLLVSGRGEDESRTHPDGNAQMHFVHLNRDEPLWGAGGAKLYVYRLAGVQVKGLLAAT
ncbi:MAG TPA: hypothetical protein ENK23_08140 [Sorangium sp.]|nr:hypothetical protein [Sorangium sp.]